VNNSLVTVLIPSYNRFKYLLNAIESIRNQTYKNFEIILIDDCSTEKEYCEFNFGEDVKIIHLEENSRKKMGFACVGGYQRNFGIKIATGNYIAFLDDDDIWFSNKIELQIDAMNKTGCKMSCTDGLIGKGIYDKDKKYKKYNAEHHYNTLQNIYRSKGNSLLKNGFPDIWNLEFLRIHNCCICSSVIITKDIVDTVGYFKVDKNSVYEDYDYWLRTLIHTDCIYIKDICFYYDDGHGYGQDY
jgi:glycosyltransferase involved in cell wall biosynthesis